MHLAYTHKHGYRHKRANMQTYIHEHQTSGAAVKLEGVRNSTVEACRFRRVDGNALLISGYARGTTIRRNSFSFIGQSAMVLLGDTDDYDATRGNQPRDTAILSNFVHELGIFEKQSSAVFQAKTCLTTVRQNIFFNMPRAAINLNDNMGGGNSIRENLIWNTCRESGDHGPINSWDRMPFLTKLKYGRPSFEPLVNDVSQNFIFANYGGSQGIDNDDGSSFYEITNNVFYSADGFKMDYGGHGSVFSGNLVLVVPYDGSNCMNMGPFLRNLGDEYTNNTCVSGVVSRARGSGCGSPACADPNATSKPMDVVGSASQCDPQYYKLRDNRYFSPHGNGSLSCGGKVLSIDAVQRQFNNDLNSVAQKLPSTQQMLQWAEAWLRF